MGWLTPALSGRTRPPWGPTSPSDREAPQRRSRAVTVGGGYRTWNETSLGGKPLKSWHSSEVAGPATSAGLGPQAGVGGHLWPGSLQPFPW